jgi:hypothetical protein
MTRGPDAREVRDITIILLLAVGCLLAGRSWWLIERGDRLARIGTIEIGIQWQDRLGATRTIRGSIASDNEHDLAQFRAAIRREVDAWAKE